MRKLDWVILILIGLSFCYIWYGLEVWEEAHATLQRRVRGVETLVPWHVGGEIDEHGCLTAAGYVWCESKQKCLRIWEEECPGYSIHLDEDATYDIHPNIGGGDETNPRTD